MRRLTVIVALAAMLCGCGSQESFETMMDLPQGQEWVFDMVNNILIEVLGTIAEQERETIRKRQAEGIEAAKQNGKKLGRPALTFPANWDSVYASWKAGEITAKTAMEQTGTKRTSFYKLVGMMEEDMK